MRILVVGLDGAAPEDLLGREDLANVRRLMEAGCYGRLEGPVRADPVQAWADLAAGAASPVRIGVPVASVPAGTDVVLVGCPVLAAGARESVATSSAARGDVERLGAADAFEPLSLPRDSSEDTLRRILDRSRRRFDVLRRFLARGDWDLLQFADPDLDVLQSAYGKGHDVVHAACRHADEEIGKVLESLEGETAVLVVSTHGPRTSDGGTGGAPSRHGAFVLAAPGVPPQGEIEGARLLDLEPTLLSLGGREVPAGHPGRNLVGDVAAQGTTDEEEERLVKERLAGLGYI